MRLWRKRVRREPSVPAEAAVGLGWRRETAWLIARRSDVRFTEVVAETLLPCAVKKRSRRRLQLPAALLQLRDRGVTVVPHGISLSLGGPDPLDLHHVDQLGKLARALHAPYVSEHICFTRAAGHDIGHLTPVPHSRRMLEHLIARVRLVQARLPVPLVLENIASLFCWPDDRLDEASFIAELLRETGAGLLLDVANLYANSLNHGVPVNDYLDGLPLERVAYVHVAGGRLQQGLYHDTHADPVADAVRDVLTEVIRRGVRRPVLLEWDHGFPSAGQLECELAALEAAVRTGMQAACPSGQGSRAEAAALATVAGPLSSSPVCSDDPLAVRQQALATALLGAGPVPDGFDAGRIGQAREALVRKKQQRTANQRTDRANRPGLTDRSEPTGVDRPGPSEPTGVER